MTDIPTLAAGLSEAQRMAMRAGAGFEGRIPSATTAGCRCALQRLGLVRDRMYAEDLTPLGEQIRNHLQEQAK